LTRLVELELITRERRMIERRIKDAKFSATSVPSSPCLMMNACLTRP
jgi:hypothetical protein